MTAAVTRHFVTIDGRWGPRQVHYRRAGRGPTVLLLHQSPQSSREMVELMQHWGLHFTVIAPDTPGYGQSDALGPREVSMADFAEALRELADALGLGRFGIYGYHTGSSIGLWLAAAHPERVTALAANGLACLTAAERADILTRYLPTLAPSWDGAHLAWLWARVREQTIFYPWYERSAATRMSFDVPDAERLHFSALEFMNAGDNYDIAYRAAFASQPGPVLAGLRVPALITATRNDPLRLHLSRLGELPPGAEVTPSETYPDAFERCLRHLLAHAGDEAPPAVATRPVAGRLWSSMVTTPDGQLRLRVNTEGNAEPLVFVHGAGESSDTALRMTGPLLGRRPLLVPDLPGHGESHPVTGNRGLTIAAAAESMGYVLSAQGINQAVLAGQGAGAWVALEASARTAFHRRRLALIDLPWPEVSWHARFLEIGLPSLAPQWHGSHLMLGWYLLRDARLFFPWFERTTAAARRIEPDLDPVRLQLELRELLKADGSWQPLLADALDYPARQALGGLAEGLLGAAPDSAWSNATQAAASACPALGWVSLPQAPELWLGQMLRQWD